MHYLPLLLVVAGSCLGSTSRSNSTAPTIKIANGTVIGFSSNGTDTFQGIPFAQPPVGDLRLRMPQSVNSSFGTLNATAVPLACIPLGYLTSAPPDTALLESLQADLPPDVYQQFLIQILGSGGPASEDCLTIKVQRPTGTKHDALLPVLYWIHGGGFTSGTTTFTDAGLFLSQGVANRQPFVYVAVNYRLGAYGFLAGKEIQKAGLANLGLHDQRLGLQWVAENIAAFGGDPAKVTIWGESAGAISVTDHLIINSGDNTYKGKPLFRAAISDSGTTQPANPVNSNNSQYTFDQVVQFAGCSNATSKIACLRDPSTNLTYAQDAFNSVDRTTAIRSYLPRADPTNGFFPVSPEVAMQKGHFSKVPFITGDQEDEGTLFSTSLANYTGSTKNITQYIHTDIPGNDVMAIREFVKSYPSRPGAGAPFHTGDGYQLYPGYKRFSAIFGDYAFTFQRRKTLSDISHIIPTWSFYWTSFRNSSVLGTFHGTDVLQIYQGIPSTEVASSMQSYFINFITNLDPNVGTKLPSMIDWPNWSNDSRLLLKVGNKTNSLIKDDFRPESYAILAKYQSLLRA